MHEPPPPCRPFVLFPEAAAAWLAAFGAADAHPAALGVVFAPATYKEVLDGALVLGRAAGRFPEAMRVVADGEARLRRLRDRLGLARRDRAHEALPRVAVVAQAEPFTLAGRWVPDLVAHAGGRAVLAEAGQPAVAVSWAALAGADPDVIVAAPGDLCVLEAHPAWAHLRAVRTGRVLAEAFDGALRDCPGPGLVDAAERLAALLHPDRLC